MSNRQLQGINIADKNILISQLADNTILFLKDDLEIPVTLKLINVFSKASGLSLNLDKCELLPIRSCSAQFLYNVPVKSQVNYLGLIICKDDHARGKLNFDPVITKAKKKLKSWLQRDLSL